MKTGTQALYRHFDAEGVLLYVGITNDLQLRSSQHAAIAFWVRFAVRTEVEWFGSRREVETAEVRVIRAEGPVFNKRHALGDWQFRILVYLVDQVPHVSHVEEFVGEDFQPRFAALMFMLNRALGTAAARARHGDVSGAESAARFAWRLETVIGVCLGDPWAQMPGPKQDELILAVEQVIEAKRREPVQ